MYVQTYHTIISQTLLYSGILADVPANIHITLFEIINTVQL